MSTTDSEDLDDRGPQRVHFLWIVEREPIKESAGILPPVGDLAEILYAKRMYMQNHQHSGAVIVWTADEEDEDNEDGVLMVYIVDHSGARLGSDDESQKIMGRLSSSHWEYLRASPPSDFECLNAIRMLVSAKGRTINYSFSNDYTPYSLEEMMRAASSELGLDGQTVFAVIANSWTNRSERGEGNLIGGYYFSRGDPSFISQSPKLTRKRLKRRNLLDEARDYLCTRSLSSFSSK